MNENKTIDEKWDEGGITIYSDEKSKEILQEQNNKEYTIGERTGNRYFGVNE